MVLSLPMRDKFNPQASSDACWATMDELTKTHVRLQFRHQEPKSDQKTELSEQKFGVIAGRLDFYI